MTEFTGERVIPGRVNDDLWAEHISRYAFAERFAPGRRILDLGCGTGYGTAELARHTRTPATGIDIACDAIQYATTHFPGPHFLQASVTVLPFEDASFDLITAFEVIEHLDDWPDLLKEARRVLKPEGLFLVSTPNRLYYTESRAEHGPNPFHKHEFDFAEFRAALTEHFPQVAIYLQNRLEAVAFYAADRYTTAEATIAQSAGNAAQANFFVALCSASSIPEAPALLYVPKASNLLRERERHIKLLEAELVQNQQWVKEMAADRDRLFAAHTELQQHYDERTRWAEDLNTKWSGAEAQMQQLQADVQRAVAAYEDQIAHLQEENRQKTQWALSTEERLSTELRRQAHDLTKAVKLLDTAEATVIERTEWARDLEGQLRMQLERVELLRQSRWVKIGRAVGLGPRLEHPDGEPE